MKSKFAALFLALALMLSMSVPALASDNGEIYDFDAPGYSEVRLTVSSDGCGHEGAVYVDNKNGTHSRVCECGEVLILSEQHIDVDSDGACDCCGAVMMTSCEHKNTSFRDNKNGTHSQVCECGYVLQDSVVHEDVDGDGSCDYCGADVDAPKPILVATVPLQMPVVMDMNGDITVSKTAKIANHQERPLTVKSISVTGLSGWIRADMSENFAVKADNEKVFAMTFRGDEYALMDGNWNIAGNDSLLLNMAINIPRQTKEISSTAIARVGFVLDWSDDANVVTSDASVGASDQAGINQANKVANDKLANRLLIFNDFARFAQSDNNYWTFGEPSQIGVVEDMLVYYGLDYKVESSSSSMHMANLLTLKSYVETQATKAQLQVMIDVTNGGTIPR